MLACEAAVEDRSALDADIMVGGACFIDGFMPNGLIDGIVVDGLGLVDPVMDMGRRGFG